MHLRFSRKNLDDYTAAVALILRLPLTTQIQKLN